MCRVKIIAAVIFLAASLCVFCSFAEETDKSPAVVPVDESLYDKDTVPVGDDYARRVGRVYACELPVLLNKTTKEVEYYRSAAENGWIPTGEQRAAIQALYDRRGKLREDRQLKGIQEEMDRNRPSGIQLEWQSQTRP